MNIRDRAIAELEHEGLLVTEWRDDPGASYSEHSHPQREVRVVIEGTMVVTTPGTRHELGPGDRVDLAPNEPHAAVVGPDGVRYLAGSDR